MTATHDGSDLWCAQASAEAQRQQFAFRRVQLGQQLSELGDALLAQNIRFQVQRQERLCILGYGLPGDRSAPSSVAIGEGVTSDLKEPGSERQTALAIGWKRVKGLEKDLLRQISCVFVAGNARAQVEIDAIEEAPLQLGKSCRVGLRLLDQQRLRARFIFLKLVAFNWHHDAFLLDCDHPSR